MIEDKESMHDNWKDWHKTFLKTKSILLLKLCGSERIAVRNRRIQRHGKLALIRTNQMTGLGTGHMIQTRRNMGQDLALGYQIKNFEDCKKYGVNSSRVGQDHRNIKF